MIKVLPISDLEPIGVLAYRLGATVDEVEKAGGEVDAYATLIAGVKFLDAVTREKIRILISTKRLAEMPVQPAEQPTRTPVNLQ